MVSGEGLQEVMGGSEERLHEVKGGDYMRSDGVSGEGLQKVMGGE